MANAKKQKTVTERCKFCKEKLDTNNFYILYSLLVTTNKNIYHVGLEKLINEVAEYIMHKGYHLSASQIVLLRPDIMKEFLDKKYKPEKTIFSVLQEYECCEECMEDYKKEVPLR
jgi:hypothetical protein